MIDLMDIFSEWLNTQVSARGWSYRELGRRSDLSVAAISDVINQKTNPTWNFCLGISHALGESPEKIFRLAGLLPSLPDPVAEEREMIHIIRHMSADTRSLIFTMLRSLRPINNHMLAEPPIPYHFQPDIEQDINRFLAEHPELEDIFTQARLELNNETLYALIYYCLFNR